MDDRDKRIFLDKIKFVYGQGTSVLIGVMITVTFLYWVLRGSITSSYLLCWYVFMILISSSRLLLVDRIIFKAFNAKNVRRWKLVHYSVLFITGTGWGLIAWFAFPEIPAHHQAFMGLIFIGLLGGMISRYSVVPIMVIIYTFPFIIPFTIRAFMQGDEFTNVLGLVMVAYSIIMVPLVNRVRKTATNSIILNRELIEEVELRKRAEKELLFMATTDSLTGISNRRDFYNQVTKELYRSERYSKECCLLILDIDYFKNVNDQFGHAAGDAELINFVRICGKELRESDFFGRVGGDEFAIFLTETNREDSVRITERLREKISASKMSYEDQEFSISTSIGAVSMTNVLNVNLNGLMNRVVFKAI